MFDHHKNIKKLSLVIASIYALAGFLWIAFSDTVTAELIDNIHLLTIIQTYKGWAYVIVTAVLLYLLTYKLFDNNSKEYERYVKNLKSKQKEVEKNRQLISTIIEQIPDAIYVKNLEGKYIFVNAGAAKLIGKSKEQMLHHIDKEIFLDENAKDIEHVDAQVLNEGIIKSNEESIKLSSTKHKILYTTKGPLKTKSGELFGLFGITRDITKAKEYENYLKKTKEQFFNLAHYDSLTKLPNRLYLLRELDQKTELDEEFTLLLIDLDGFKVINDSYGHSYGDELIKKIAKDVTKSFNNHSFIARSGGDEFGVIMASLNKKSIEKDIDSLYATLNNPFIIDQIEVYVTVSIGITFNISSSKDRETLLQEADSAMGNAKRVGKNTFSYFSSSFTEDAILHTTISTNLKNALNNEELELFYQPQNDCVDESLIGAEALIRWHDGDKYISPAAFIPVAEETGLILDVGKFVMHSGFAFAKQLQDAGLFKGKIAINISAKEFNHLGFLQYIHYIIKKTGSDPHYIELEITESSILNNPEKTIITLQKLRELGFSIAIDDFGTGYSSLAYLKKLPIDKLKIDQIFIRDVINDPKNQTIVKTIIALAKGLGISVLAEGVETREELEFLKEHGVDYIQGYLFSKPLQKEVFEKSLTQ